MGFYCQVKPDGTINTDSSVTYPSQLIRRGTAFQNDWLLVNNLDIKYDFDIGKASTFVRISVFNVLNRQARIGYTETGTDSQGRANPYYQTVSSYQGGRSARLQFGLNF